MTPRARREPARRSRPRAAQAFLLCVASGARLCAGPTEGGETERVWLSGEGPDSGLTWEFRVSEGRRAGVWSTAPVPSQWELEGFGRFAYGFEEAASDEVGSYRHRFEVPRRWAGRRIRLVFEGVMTDCAVRLNHRLAGPVHQGGFTRFVYDVTDLVRFGGENLLEVLVEERSADASVNRAEREADYWVFGGIYRPVYLEAVPVPGVAELRIDARHDGRLRFTLSVLGQGARRLDGTLIERSSGRVVHRFSRPVGAGAVSVEEMVTGARSWSAEDPRLYEMNLQLHGRAGLLHRVVEVFGFRSFEVRPGGLYVNDRRVRLKGINRHSFWPTSGRALTAEINRRDAELIKGMNANAVRTAHYPPDPAFLEACDELGLYVIDELPGWHDAYDTEPGRRLVREMVSRDHNHPAVIAWANGNEGGWNPRLDAEFRRHDLQNRPVLHPDAVFGGLDTRHYPSFGELRGRLEPSGWQRLWQRLRGLAPPVLPTEALHGLYDGGLGAGLEDFWRLVRSSERGAGLFLWTFVDEGVVRADRGGMIDTFENFAPDGIVGPFREKEGSYWAVRSIWSPVALVDRRLSSTGPAALQIENRYDLVDLEGGRFIWEWLRFPSAGEGHEAVLERGEISGPELAPGGRAWLEIRRSAPAARAAALRLRFLDGAAREAAVWVLPVPGAADAPPADTALAWREPVAVRRREGGVVLTAGETRVEIRYGSGTRAGLTLRNPPASLRLSLRELDGVPPRLQTAEEVTQGKVEGLRLSFAPPGSLREAGWFLEPDGWLRLDYRVHLEAPRAAAGVLLAGELAEARRLRWLGRGPYRVWANRLHGALLGLWEKEWNDTVTGVDWRYPEFKGFHAGVRWARLATPGGDVTLRIDPEEVPFLGVLQPSFAEGMAPDGSSLSRHTDPWVHAPGLALLHGIPPMGTKFHPPEELGPQGRSQLAPGSYEGSAWLRLTPRYTAPLPGSG